MLSCYVIVVKQREIWNSGIEKNYMGILYRVIKTFDDDDDESTLDVSYGVGS